MIRTRDFFLYGGVMVFLLIGITTTIVTDQWRAAPAVEEAVKLEEGIEPGAIISTESDVDFRQANVERLKQKLAENESVIEVPTDFQIEEEVVSEAKTDGGVQSDLGVMWCSNDSQLKVPTWPTGKVSVAVVEGVRIVTTDNVSPVQVGSTTKMSTTTTTLLQLPIRSYQAAEPSCVDSLAIGVTPGGDLLRNNFAANYQSHGQYSLVGYARDGFPIYGKIPNESDLDVCGGLMTPTGYQYHVRSNSSDVLNCFSGSPVSFISP